MNTTIQNVTRSNRALNKMQNLKHSAKRCGCLTAAVASVYLGLAPSVFASFDLGSAAGWAILELGNGTIGGDTHINNPSPPAVADGNVGIVGYMQGGSPKGGTFNSSGPDVTGGLFLGTGASYQLSGGAQIIGGVTTDYGPLTGPDTNPLGAPVYNDALAAYNSAKGLMASTPVANQIATLSTAQSLSAGVYTVGTLNLSGDSLTLNGSASDYFIFNITTKFNMQNAAEIVLSGGITADHVLWNLVGGVDVSTSGGLNQETIIRGIILGLEGSKVNLSPGAYYGEIAVSGDISLASGSEIHNPVPGAPVPEPTTFIAGALLLLPLGASTLRILRRKATA